MRLKDKVAIITGGAHGMGEVEARLFAEEGAKVVIADVLVKEGEAVAADISAGQRQARFVRTDVTSESDWQRLIAETIAAYGRLDILVNNAGISGSAVGDADGLEGWQRLLAVNSTSVFLGTKLAAAEMAKAGGGSIVNISSIMGIVASEESHPGYPASKAAVRNYTKAAACRYGPQGVRVNSVHPGTCRRCLTPPTLPGARRRLLRRRCAAWANRSKSHMACYSWRPTRLRSSPGRNW